MRPLISFMQAFILLLAALILPACTTMFESNFYHPSRDPFPTPAGVQDISIPTPDGLTLHAWLLRPPNSPPGAKLPAVLHVHGNAGNISSHAAYSAFLTDHGFAVLIFDYRSYGRSDPAPTRLRRDLLLTDTLAALDTLRTLPGIDSGRIAIFGSSLGGVLGVAAAADRPDHIRAVVSVAAFSSWKSIARLHAGAVGAMVIPAGLDAAESITKLGTRPALIVHGEADDIVPISHARELAAAAAAASVPARLIAVPDIGHNDILIDDAALEGEIARFLRAALTNPPG